MTSRRVVVTGGAGGIGGPTTRLFLRRGFRVAVVDRDAAALDTLAREFPGVSPIVADVSDSDSVARAFRDVDAALGGLDVLVACAGISRRRPFLEISVEEWHEVLRTNLDGVFFCCRESIVRMGSEGGALLLMGSTNGIVGYPYYAPYNVTKAGVIELARSLAIECAPRIRVNAVCPGYVLTPMQAREYTTSMIEQVNSQIPLRRHAHPEEIAELLFFLASDCCPYISGQAIVVDGGELAGGLASAGVRDS